MENIFWKMSHQKYVEYSFCGDSLKRRCDFFEVVTPKKIRRNILKMSHQKNEEEDCRKQKAPRGVSLWSVLIFLPLLSHLWQYIFSLIFLKLLSHMKTCFLNHCAPTIFFNLVHRCFPQLLSHCLPHQLSLVFLKLFSYRITGFNHFLYFLLTRSIKILIRAPRQVLVKPKILINRCLFTHPPY